MLRQRPRSTLFPYATLFRSVPVQRTSGEGVPDVEVVSAVERYKEIVALAAESVERMRAADRARVRDLLDRKSTRLNSSHLVISYAVFCLKKKKKTRESRYTD